MGPVVKPYLNRIGKYSPPTLLAGTAKSLGKACGYGILMQRSGKIANNDLTFHGFYLT